MRIMTSCRNLAITKGPLLLSVDTASVGMCQNRTALNFMCIPR